MSSDNKITYETFTERVAKRADVSTAEADAYIHQFSETASEALEEGDEVQLYRFGRFVTKHVDERAGHNPGTGEAITIPQHTRVDFRPYKALLLAVNWPYRHLRTRMLSENVRDIRFEPLICIMLLLALLALILAGFAIKSWVSSPDSTVAKPAVTTTDTEPPAAEVAPVVTAPEPVTTVEVETRDEVTVAPVEATPAPSRTTDFLVRQGDTLWQIAALQWGDPYWWPVIYAKNQAELEHKNPDLIKTGITLRLPVLSGSVAQPTAADLKLKTRAYQIVARDYTRLGHSMAAEYRFVADRGFSE